MFENLGTAIVQAIGFLGVFVFFTYQLFSDKRKNMYSKKNKNKVSSSAKSKADLNRNPIFKKQLQESAENLDQKKGFFKWLRK